MKAYYTLRLTEKPLVLAEIPHWIFGYSNKAKAIKHAKEYREMGFPCNVWQTTKDNWGNAGIQNHPLGLSEGTKIF